MLLALTLTLAVQAAPVQTKYCGTATGQTDADRARAVSFCHAGSGIVEITSLHADKGQLIITLGPQGVEKFKARIDAEFVTRLWLSGWRTASQRDTLTITGRIGTRDVVTITAVTGQAPRTTWHERE